MIRAVAFDMDDTLYPERAFVFSGYRAVSEAVEAELGFPIYDELVDLFQSGRRGDLFTPVLARHLGAVEESYVKRLVAVYRAHRPVIAPFPEAAAVLEEIRGRYRMALISDGIEAVQQRKLDALGLRPLFEAIVMTDAFGREFWKPTPCPSRTAPAGSPSPPRRWSTSATTRRRTSSPRVNWDRGPFAYAVPAPCTPRSGCRPPRKPMSRWRRCPRFRRPSRASSDSGRVA